MSAVGGGRSAEIAAVEENPFDACPDSGRCWHGCPITDGKGIPCWRVQNCAPLSLHGDDWTSEEKAAHA